MNYRHLHLPPALLPFLPSSFPQNPSMPSLDDLPVDVSPVIFYLYIADTRTDSL